MSKVLTLSKCFKSPAVFSTTFCFAGAEHIILMLLIIASREPGTLFLAVNNILTCQFNQTRNLEVDGKKPLHLELTFITLCLDWLS